MFEENTSIIKLRWVIGLAPSHPVSQSAKYFKIIGPGRKKKENKKMGNFSAAHRTLTGEIKELQV